MTTLDETPAAQTLLEPAAPASGTRSGALLAAASGASIVLNYAFLLAAGRILGSDRYGSLAALLGALAVVLIPAAAVQMAVSREISRLIARGDEGGADAFARAALRLALLLTVPLVVVAVGIAPLLADVLHIHETGVVALAQFTFVTALIFPVALGVLQGRQRFHALGALYVFPFIVRLGLLAIVVPAGYRLGGTVLAVAVGAIAAAALAVGLITDSLRRAARRARPDLRPFLRYLAPVGVGLIGTALLTHVDILVVKARFSANDAGAYAAASAFARVAFFVPATILAVLFPRTAARHARGEATEDILGRSLIATALFCGGLVLFYLATGVGLVTATFGHDFAEGGRVLAPFALAIGLFSVAQIYVGYHLSRGETKYAWIVAGAVLLQVAVLASVPTTLRGVVWANVVIGAALIAAHEVFAESSIPALRAGVKRLSGVVVRVRSIVPETLLVTAGTTALVCAVFWPVTEHFGSTILGGIGQDSTGSVTDLWLQAHETGYHVLGQTHHTMTAAPFGWDQTNAINAQLVLPYYPTYLVGHLIGYVAAYNLITFAGYVLSGVAMYFLVRYLGCSRPVACWATVAFVVFPFHLAHDQHASLIHLEVLVLLIATLIAAALRPTWLRLALVGVANLACWFTSGYFGPMAAVTTVAFAIGASLASRRAIAPRLVLGSAAAALGAAAVLGFDAVASGTNAGAGLHRSVTDLSIFGVRPVDLVVPPPGNLVLGNHLDAFWARHTHGANETETAIYLGLLTIALGVAWLVVAATRWQRLEARTRVATAGLLAAFVAGLVFAAPSPLVFFGHRVSTPARLLWALVPAFRVLSRWDFLLMAALVPLAALGLQSGWQALMRRRRWLAAAAVGAAIVFSFLELMGHPWRFRFRTVPVPPEYSALADAPRGILAEYPLGYSDIFRLWQMHHGRPLLNGAPPNTSADSARLMLLDPTQPGTAEALSLLGVSAIGIHPNAHVDAEVLPGNPATDRGYRLVGRFSDGSSIWDVVAPPAPGFVTLAGVVAPRREQNGLVGYPFVAASGVGAMLIAAKESAVGRLVFDARPPTSGRLLRIGDGSVEKPFALHGWTRISILVQIPRGQSELLLKTDPPATSEADAISISTPRLEPASGQPALHAKILSPSPGF